VAGCSSPRARIDVYESPLAHETLFASPQAAAPPGQLVLITDGQATSPIFRISDANQAAVMDDTPIAAVYRTFLPRRVLLLGEVGGANIWLARRFGASQITMVQPNPQCSDLLRGPLAARVGHVLDRPDVEVVNAELRGFLDRSTQRFDLIQLVALEDLVSGAPGITALSESYLPTLEGIGRCLNHLNPGGVVAVVRGIQEPPRDNVRLLATFVETLERNGVQHPDNQVLQFRNYLAACTVLTADPLTPTHLRRLRNTLADMTMDPVWYPTMPDGEANRIDRRPGPPGTALSYLDWAARQILSPQRTTFYATYAFDVRPATDDRPFFSDSFRWQSLPRYTRAFGTYWLARVEWGYVVLIAALLWSTGVAALLILIPSLRRPAPDAGRFAHIGTGVYYASLGTGYMLLEMTLIQQFGLVLADPVFAVAVVLAALLVFSGLGCAWTGRRSGAEPRSAAFAALTVAAVAGLYALIGRPALSTVIGASLPTRVGACLLIAALVAVPMGMPFPRGLACLSAHARGLIPWAWAANGFASVVAAILAVVLAMSFGFSAVTWLAAGAYAAAALSARWLPGGNRGSV
jgi:hypothetical protein